MITLQIRTIASAMAGALSASTLHSAMSRRAFSTCAGPGSVGLSSRLGKGYALAAATRRSASGFSFTGRLTSAAKTPRPIDTRKAPL